MRICTGYDLEEHRRWTLVRVHWREGDGAERTEEHRFSMPDQARVLEVFLDQLHGDAP